VIDVRSPILNLFLQTAAPKRGRGVTAIFRHFGAAGLFFLAIVDSLPVPTFNGPDILIAVLASRHTNPWYELAAVTTVGSLIGAFFTFRLARRAGSAYLHSKFEKRKVSVVMEIFERWGAVILIATTAIPFPLPTTAFFAVAGATNYPQNRYLAIVAGCRAVRYMAIAIVGDHYGRNFVRMLRHPTQYWGWFLALIVLVCALVVTAILVNKRLSDPSTAPAGPVSGR
jgi:membrane protein YqaA with SNARE-associated domain